MTLPRQPVLYHFATFELFKSSYGTGDRLSGATVGEYKGQCGTVYVTTKFSRPEYEYFSSINNINTIQILTDGQ